MIWNLRPGTFRVRGDSLDVVPAYQDRIGYRITFFGDEVERIIEFDSITGELRRELKFSRSYLSSQTFHHRRGQTQTSHHRYRG